MYTASICTKCGREFSWDRYPSSIERKYCSLECSETKGNPKHNDCFSPLWFAWTGMKKRCDHDLSYVGISVCEEWKNSFEAFRDWALANGYKEGLSLDRKQGCSIYSPESCRWITLTEQQRNVGKKQSTTASSRYKGVGLLYEGRWKACSSIGGPYKYIGLFSSEEQAALAYDCYVVSVDPEHAYLNFPELKEDILNKRIPIPEPIKKKRKLNL